MVCIALCLEIGRACASDTGARTAITGFGIQGDERRTRLSVMLDRPVRFDIYALADPYRIIIDLAGASLGEKAPAIPPAKGLILELRQGPAMADRGRIVIATRGPVAVDAATVFRVPGDKAARLDIDLIETAAGRYRVVAPPGSEAIPDISIATRPQSPERRVPRAKPVVVIDPGHGGSDPGTTSGEIAEKTVVLAVARHAKALIEARGRLTVALTRAEDAFVSLAQRVSISRMQGARLFISIHADSLAGGQIAQSVRGATIYTLSEQASNEEARLLAEKENASDALGDVDSRLDENDAQIKGILIDLVRRDAAQSSSELRSRLLPHIRSSIGLSRDPARAAAFKVLRQADIPAVLIELGYMSNPHDAQLLASPDWQRKVAGSIAAAVEEYFAHRPDAIADRARRTPSR